MMGVKISIEVECDRCKQQEKITKETKSPYGEFPENWGDICLEDPRDFRLSRSRKPDFVICDECINDFKKWLNV